MARSTHVRDRRPPEQLVGDMNLPLSRTRAVARGLVEAGRSSSVRVAASSADADPVAAVVGEGAADHPIGWLCGGKPLLAYGALRAAAVGGVGVDDDLRGHIPTAAGCPRITLREILTFRSGLTRNADPCDVLCFTEPRLSRPRHWDPAVDAEYWNAGWDVIPVLTTMLTGLSHEKFLLREVLEPEFGIVGTGVRLDLAFEHILSNRDPGHGIRRVMASDELATSLGGPLTDLCRFYRGVASTIASDVNGKSLASVLTSDNPGPQHFQRGVSPDLSWSLGFPARMAAQGFERVVDSSAFGSMGSVLTWTARGLQYAWVTVAGALPSLRATIAVAMQGLRPVPDDRYIQVVEALLADLSERAE